MDSNATLIFPLILLIVASAFFSASETAYTSLNRVRVKNMATSGSKRAEKVLALSENYDKLLSGILVGNNIVNILSASLATVLFVNLIGSKGVSVSSAVMTVVVLMFGEITPKTIAKQHPEAVAFALYPLLSGIMKLTIGPKDLLLYAGDSIYFDPTIPHGMKAIGGPVDFMAIVIPPRGEL